MITFPRHVNEDNVRLMWAAASVVATGGVEALTMRKVAVAARMPLGTLVHRSGGRDDLLDVVARVARLGLVSADGGTTPVGQLLPDGEDAAALEVLWLALGELARVRPRLAAVMTGRDQTDDWALADLGLPECSAGPARALVRGLRAVVHDPAAPLPRPEAVDVLLAWVGAEAQRARSREPAEG